MKFIKNRHQVNITPTRIRNVLVRLEGKGVLKSRLEATDMSRRYRRAYYLTVKGDSYFNTMKFLLGRIL